MTISQLFASRGVPEPGRPMSGTQIRALMLLSGRSDAHYADQLSCPPSMVTMVRNGSYWSPSSPKARAIKEAIADDLGADHNEMWGASDE